jgi:hypothetical protein
VKSTTFKKLTLKRETVRRLKRSDLDQAAGGYGTTESPTAATCNPSCDERTCADTCVYPCEIPPPTLELGCG